MSVNKVQLANGETIIDISDSTVTPETLAEGVVAYNAKGERIVGTMKAGSGGANISTSDDGSGNVTVKGMTAHDDGEGNVTVTGISITDSDGNLTAEINGNITIGG